MEGRSDSLLTLGILIDGAFALTLIIVRGLNLQEHHNCSNLSTSINFGPEVDMTVMHQFLEGAKLGSRCDSHAGQIQDGSIGVTTGHKIFQFSRLEYSFENRLK